MKKPKPRRTARVKVRRCADPQCKQQLEIALDTILMRTRDLEKARSESGELFFEVCKADESLYSYTKSYHANQAALRAILELAIHDVGGRIYFRAEEARKLMELAK